jgi:hypothetical protein
MKTILLTNHDGIDSPMLVPLAPAGIGTGGCPFNDWVSKAITPLRLDVYASLSNPPRAALEAPRR